MAQDGKKQYVEVPKKVTREQALEIGRQLFDAIEADAKPKKTTGK